MPDPAATVEMWPLSQIIPYDKNPRTHPPSQVAALAKLMAKYGVDQPIVVDEGGIILKGHGRLLAAQFAEFTEFPVVVRKGLTDDDKRAIRIADNQMGLLSGWDDKLLKEEIKQFGSDFDLDILGFSKGFMNEFGETFDSEAKLMGLKYAVIVECESEAQQATRLDQFTKMGMSCRALIS